MLINEYQKPYSKRVTQERWDSIFNDAKSLTGKDEEGVPAEGGLGGEALDPDPEAGD